MRPKRLSAALFALLITFIMTFPVFASAGSVGASVNETGNGLIDLLPETSPLGVPINSHEYTDLIYTDIKFCTPYDKPATWTFPYSDQFFEQPENAYSHVFAQGTLGLAVASFRSKDVNKGGYSDLENYFTSIGFGNISAEPFRHTPTANSVTYAIASKELSDQTVIAAVCCGAGYEAEWSSNLTVGDQERHRGFDEAARTVEQALKEYIDENGLTGKITLWTGGYSRAAAIANLVAGDMSDDRTFSKVYCYTFATPATTAMAASHPNIFNIIGKNDPVPMIPFSDWDYTRNGSDLYLPSVQMDSDFARKIKKLDDILVRLDGHKYRYNPEFCSELRIFFDYLNALIPNSSEYCTDLQPGVLSVMANGSGGNILSLVSRIVSTFSPKTDQEMEDLNSLLEYVEQLANRYVLQGNKDQINAGYWDTSMNLTQNLTLEHDPDRYIAWMFSDSDPVNIFGQNTDYKQFTVKGNVSLHIYDMTGYLITVRPDGSLVHADPDGGEARDESEIPRFFIQEGSGQLNITIPGDREYVIGVDSPGTQTITYYTAVHTLDTVRTNISDSYSLEVEPGNYYFMYFGTEGSQWEDKVNTDARVTETWSGTALYSPGLIMKLQNINFLHLTFAQILIFAGILVLFAYSELIVCATLGFVRIFQSHQRRSIPTIAVHFFNAAVFLAVEVATWYFIPAYPLIKLAAKLISFLFIFTLAFVALTEHFSKKNFFINLGLLIFMVLSVLFEDRLIPNVSPYSVIIKSAFYAVLCIAAALTWMGHTRRRTFKMTEVEKKRYEKKVAKAEKAMQKAYDRSEKATQKYLQKQRKLQNKKVRNKS